MKENSVNGIRRHILAKHMYFSPHINLKNIIDNATTRINWRGNERYQYKAYNKPNVKARGNWKVT
jgi:hypothetical protein